MRRGIMGIVTIETGISGDDLVKDTGYRIVTLLILVLMSGAVGLTYASASPSLAVVDETVPQIVKINGP
jgi:hypothetical protein